MRSLLEGVKRYETTKRRRYSERFAALASGQEPLALFITCSDSRVVPSLIALADPGQLFVVRNVANLVPPVTVDDQVGADASVSSAVFYALEVLKIRDVVVCGHSGCGGMKAVLEGAGSGSGSAPRALERWLTPASRAVERLRERGPFDASLPDHDQLSQISALQQLENLQTRDHVRRRVEAGDVRLHAWWFDIAKGRLLAYSREASQYVPAIEAPELDATANAAE